MNSRMEPWPTQQGVTIEMAAVNSHAHLRRKYRHYTIRVFAWAVLGAFLFHLSRGGLLRPTFSPEESVHDRQRRNQ